MIAVRDAQLEDLDFVVACNLALARESESKQLDPEVLTRGVARALAEPDRLRYWIAERDGVPIGQAAITREWSDWRCGDLWWLQSVFVLPDQRGRGVFRALHDHIRDTAKAAGDVVGLRLYVERDNAAGIATYRALGFVPGGYEVMEEVWV